MAIDVTYTFTPLTIIESAEVNTNFTDLRDDIRGAHHQDADGTLLVNADIAAGAAIAYSKLNLSSSIVNADVNASAAIAESKLAFDGTSGHDHSGGANGKVIDPTDLSGASANVTGANLSTLTAGAASNADTLHSHDFGVGFSVGMHLRELTTTRAASTNIVGFSEDSSPYISAMGGGNVHFMFGIATDSGIAVYPLDTRDRTNVSATFLGCVRIGSDDWECRDSGGTTTIEKNGSAVSFSGGAEPREGSMSYDPTNAYLLVLVDAAAGPTTTSLKRFSGVAGTTLTFVDTITLDSAVSNRAGFLYDDTNDEFICLDLAGNQVIKFNISGVTQETAAYTVDDTHVKGLAMINDRVHLVLITSTGAGVSSGPAYDQGASVALSFVPTTMTRT